MSLIDDFLGALGAEWVLRDVLGGGVITTALGNLSITVLALSDHVNNNTTKTAPAIVRNDIANLDFQIDVHVVSPPGANTSICGILVEQDSDDWLKFEDIFTGGQLRALAGSTVSGTTTVQATVAIGSGNGNYLRVTRLGNAWTFQTSPNGITYTTRASFSRTMTVTAWGVYAGNSGGLLAPLYICLIDSVILTQAAPQDITVAPNNAAPASAGAAVHQTVAVTPDHAPPASQQGGVVQTIPVAPLRLVPAGAEAVVVQSLALVPDNAAPDSQEGALGMTVMLSGAHPIPAPGLAWLDLSVRAAVAHIAPLGGDGEVFRNLGRGEDPTGNHHRTRSRRRARTRSARRAA